MNNYKNAYEYLLDYQSQKSSRMTSKINFSQEAEQLSARKQNIIEQPIEIKSSRVNLKNLDESKEVKINLGENPFDLATSLNYQFMQQSKQNNKYENQLLQESNKIDEYYEIKIKTLGPIKEEVLSFLQLLGQVEIKKIEPQQEFNYSKSKSFYIQK